eukprot:m.309695 g.309695  ORF g.309695 m.309695 type:complete len:1622 (+) comp47390_c0_seq1:223-5088(+)
MDDKAEIKKLKSDLETERQRVKQCLREKTVELRQAKQEAGRERDRAIAEALKRHQTEKSAELKALRDALTRQKEQEVRHIAKYKDEEMRQTKEQLGRERTSAVRHAAAGARKETMESFRDQIETDRSKSMEELWILREQKTRLEEEVRLFKESERENAELTRRMKQEHEAEREQLIRNAKQEAARDAQQIRLAERIVRQKEQEALQHQHHAKLLEVEKETLGEELSRIKETESWEKRDRRSLLKVTANSSTASNESLGEGLISLGNKRVSSDDKDMLVKTVRGLEDKVVTLRMENATLKQDDKVKRLRQRNKELVLLARRLEDQNKALKDNTAHLQSNVGSGKELETFKKGVAKERAKEQAEHVRVLSAKKRKQDELAERLAMKEREVEALRQRMDNRFHKDSVDELVKVREKVESLEQLMKTVAKEKLHFERNLTENPTSASQLQDLQVRFGGLQQKHRQLETKLATKDSEVAELSEKLVRMEEKEKDLQAAVQKLASDNARLESDLEVCVTSRAELERRITIAEEKASEVETIKTQCSSLENQLQQAEHFLGNAQEDNSKLLQQVEEANKKFKIAENDIVRLQSALKAAELKIAERDTEIDSFREKQNPLRLSLSGNDIVEELQVRVRDLEEECAEKELQHIALQDQLERMGDREAGLDVVKLDSDGDGDIGGVEPNEFLLKRRTSTEKLIDSLEDSSDDSDSDIMAFLKKSRKVNGIISKGSPIEAIKETNAVTAVTEEAAATDGKPVAVAAVTEKKKAVAGSPPPAVGSLRDELAALGENVESEYDTYSESESEKEEGRSEADQADESGEESAEDEFGANDVLELLDSNGDKVPSKLRQPEGGVTTTAKAILSPPSPANMEGSGKKANNGVSVFVARFNYNPEMDSPNDNPEAELCLKRGEYVYVYGSVDEDGFYEGETEDGRKGLVPSNFIDQVPVDSAANSPSPVSEKDLAPASAVNPAYQLNSTELETVEEEDEGSPDDSHKDITVNESTLNSMDDSTEKSSLSDFIPPPGGVKVEREFARSLLIKWTGPSDSQVVHVQGYHVYVDGNLKAKTAGNTKQRALVEGIDFLAGKLKLTVRTVTDQGESADSEVLLVGKASIPVPADVGVSVTRDGQRALNVSWTPVAQSSCPESKLTGYRVYIDEVTAAQVYDPSAKCVAINQFTISTLYTANPHTVHIVATSVDGESKRTEPVTFSDVMLKPETPLEEVLTTQVEAPEKTEVPKMRKLSGEVAEAEAVPTGKKVPSVDSELSSEDADVDEMVSAYKSQLKESNDSDGKKRETEAEKTNITTVSSSSKPPILSSMFAIIDKEEEDDDEDDDDDEGETQPLNSDNSEGEILEVFASPVQKSLSPASPVPVLEAKKRLEIVSIDEPEEDEPDGSGKVRRFVALFNYDPSMMSPNDDGADEELAFQKGDTILVSGDKDEDGFYIGELNGHQGLVPCNMISELADSGCVVDEVSASDQTLSPTTGEEISEDTADLTAAMIEGRPMIALYHYNPSEMSPNADLEVELDFKAGELIYVIGEVDSDGFYQGQKPTGKRGLVPSNFLEPVSQNRTEEVLPENHPDENKSPSASEMDTSTNSTQGNDLRKKKKGLLSKGKNLVRRLGRVGRSKNK